MPRVRSASRWAAESSARSPATRSGRWRGRPGWPRPRGIASTRGTSWGTSWACAAVKRAASGRPCASVMIWCGLPSFRRSVGFGPVWPPLKRRAPMMSQPPPATRRAPPPGGASLRARQGVAARHRPAARRVDTASRSVQTRRPVPGAEPPRECRASRRTRSRSALCAALRACVLARARAGALRGGATAGSAPIKHHPPVASPCVSRQTLGEHTGYKRKLRRGPVILLETLSILPPNASQLVGLTQPHLGHFLLDSVAPLRLPSECWPL